MSIHTPSPYHSRSLSKGCEYDQLGQHVLWRAGLIPSDDVVLVPWKLPFSTPQEPFETEPPRPPRPLPEPRPPRPRDPEARFRAVMSRSATGGRPDTL